MNEIREKALNQTGRLYGPEGLHNTAFICSNMLYFVVSVASSLLPVKRTADRREKTEFQEEKEVENDI